MKSGFQRRSRRVLGPLSSSSAFTLIELLVVIAIIALLASLLIPSLGKVRAQAVDLKCRNQIRQVTLAWQLYADDNEGRFAPNRLNSVGSWVGGIMGFESTDVDSTNANKLLDPAWAKLGPYVRVASLLKCPSDLSKIGYMETNPRVRSYSMNAAVGLPAKDGDLPFSPGWRSYRRSSDITSPGPAQLWVVTEEHPDGIDDCVFTVDCESRGASARFISVPAHYHDGAANFSFADGHVERHRWQDARMLLPNKYCGCVAHYAAHGYFTDLPDSPDVAWLQERSSSRN